MNDFGPPPSVGRLRRFPSRTLRAGHRIYRLHHRGLGPFWFSSTPPESDGGNRFDLPPPSGASYWALQPAVALLETLARRPVTMIPTELLDRYELAQARLPNDLAPIANLPVQATRGFGLTAEIHTTSNRRQTRSWAAALADAGFRAILGLPRHDVTGRYRTLTLWGQAGEHPPYGWKWETESLSINEASEALAPWGIRIVPIPFDVPTTRPSEQG